MSFQVGSLELAKKGEEEEAINRHLLHLLIRHSTSLDWNWMRPPFALTQVPFHWHSLPCQRIGVAAVIVLNSELCVISAKEDE